MLPVTTVDDYAENILAQQISQIPGIAQVNIGGQQKPAVRVQIDPTKLAALGLQMEDVAGVISAATVDAPEGFDQRADARDDHLRQRPVAESRAVERCGRGLQKWGGGPDPGYRRRGGRAGKPLFTAWQNGRNGILLLIYKQPGANVIDAVERVKRCCRMHSPRCRRRSRWIPWPTAPPPSKRRCEDVEITLGITIVLVVLVIFLFLRNAWATIIPGVTVPLALLGTVAMMYVLNFSLDNLSLMALTIAVGFVVDDAIVMLENIYRHIEAGMTPMQATLKGAGEIGFTILSISISLVAVFIPLLLMGGIIGRLFREFAITMTMTIAVSAFVALDALAHHVRPVLARRKACASTASLTW